MNDPTFSPRSFRSAEEKASICLTVSEPRPKDFYANRTFQKIEQRMVRGKRLGTKEIQEIREKVSRGNRTKISIAKEYDVCYRTVWNYTKDIPGCGRKDKNTNNAITPEKKKEIRSRVLKERNKKAVADSMNVPYHTVLYLTKDIHVSCKRREKLINELNDQGYAFCGGEYYTPLRRSIMMQSSNVNVVKFHSIPIIYVEGREKEAAKALIARVKKARKRMSPHIIKQITRDFRITLSKDDLKD